MMIKIPLKRYQNIIYNIGSTSFYNKEILKIAGEIYDNLLEIVVNNTLYSLTPTATQHSIPLKTKKYV